ncbi:MAG: Mur ligase family protein, partial [Bacteroidetes bacterium]|nr:Mur ligase family protein [Bacteroidota bacterium]
SGAYRKPGVPKTAILNADDGSYPALKGVPADRQYTYALDGPADFRAGDIRVTPEGSSFLVHTPHGQLEVHTRLLGRFNVYNALAALGVASSQGIAGEAIQRGIEAVGNVPGRMEPVDEGQDFKVLVDFAVTPNALQGALIVMFGCAGLRDAQKRPIMGEMAGRLADATVITADDPRTEDLEEIMRQIAAGCAAAGRREGDGYWMIGDREEAIAFALGLARPGDVVLLAGKGHERSLAIGDEERPWDEVEVARAALRRLQAGKRGRRQ